jgi:hypothetical protein
MKGNGIEWNGSHPILPLTFNFFPLHHKIYKQWMKDLFYSTLFYSTSLYSASLHSFRQSKRASVFSIHHHSFIAPPIGRYDIIVGSWGRGWQSLINTLSLEQQHNWLLSPHFCSKSQGIIRFMDSLIYMLLNINSSIQCET